MKHLLKSLDCVFNDETKNLHPIESPHNYFSVTDPIVQFSNIFHVISNEDRNVIESVLNEEEKKTFLKLENEKKFGQLIEE
jgi:hypothetical protein